MSAKTDTTLERTEQYTFFQGKKSPFSMQYDTTFVLKGKLFRSVDQYLYYKKAILFNDIDNAQKILETNVASEQKKLASQVKGVDPYRWSKNSPDFLYEANRAKFIQHPNLLEQLFSTRGTNLVEADPNDKIFGIGMGMSNEDKTDPSKWKGSNQLGKLLTHLREDLYSGLEMNKIIAELMEQCLSPGDVPLPESEDILAEKLIDSLAAILAIRSKDEPKDRWSVIRLEKNISAPSENFESDEDEESDLMIEQMFQASVHSSPVAFYILHETDFETFKYPVSLRILRTLDGNRLSNQINYWKDIESVENTIAAKSNNLHKGYHLAFSEETFYTSGDGETIHSFGTQKERERAMGTLVLKIEDTEHLVTLRGQYKTDKWNQVGAIHYLVQQILPAQWK